MKVHGKPTTLGEKLVFSMNAMFFHPSSDSDVYTANNTFQK